MAQKFPSELLSLISYLKKLPGVGNRTAERFAFELIDWPNDQLSSLSSILLDIKAKIPACELCGCLTDQGACKFCNQPHRDFTQLCILGSQRDVFSIEETHSFRGLYHVIDHLLSPLDGRHPEQLNVQKIKDRIASNHVSEIILGFDSTLEGDTTALYLKSQLKETVPSISRLAFGIPMGSSLEYIDGGTLARAFKGRQSF